MPDTLPDEWRKILALRSMKDKVAIAIECDVAPVDSLPAVSALVSEGYIVWIDRAVLPHLALQNTETGELRRGVACDIFRLTDKGIALCDAHGIARH